MSEKFALGIPSGHQTILRTLGNSLGQIFPDNHCGLSTIYTIFMSCANGEFSENMQPVLSQCGPQQFSTNVAHHNCRHMWSISVGDECGPPELLIMAANQSYLLFPPTTIVDQCGPPQLLTSVVHHNCSPTMSVLLHSPYCRCKQHSSFPISGQIK